LPRSTRFSARATGSRWAAHNHGKLAFESHSDAGFSFNYSGAAQNDPASGDIRIGAHRFDGVSKVLAHTYFPPPNGSTAAGDAHFDQAEKWTLGAGSSIVGGSGGGGGSRGNLVLGGLVGAESAALLMTVLPDESAAEPITTTFVSPPVDSVAQLHDVRSIGTVALVTGSVQVNAATDRDDLANTSSGDNGDLISGDASDPAWLDALAWQRIEFGQAAC
jgi:Matrixin